MRKNPRFRVKFGLPSTLIYLQNSGFENGKMFSSSIFSCNLKLDTAKNLFNRASILISDHYRNTPIQWNNVLQKQLLAQESIDAENIGNDIRNNCNPIDTVYFKGGYIYGGVSGDKFIDLPKYRANHLPFGLAKKDKVVMNICAFRDGKHQCDMEIRNGSVNDIREYQSIITKFLFDQDLDYWQHSHSPRKEEVITNLKKLQTEFFPSE